ncbi:hypothetical protein AURDEDRAFT_113865, partial [Auricularia subglabra TFB-10046 SS5]
LLCFCPVVSAWSCCFGLSFSLTGLATLANINSPLLFAGYFNDKPLLPSSGLMAPTTAWNAPSGVSFIRGAEPTTWHCW